MNSEIFSHCERISAHNVGEKSTWRRLMSWQLITYYSLKSYNAISGCEIYFAMSYENLTLNRIWDEFLIYFKLDNNGQSEWIGDGFCDDMNNNEYCIFQDVIGPGSLLPLWDAGDCCGANAKIDFCTNCTCNGELFFRPIRSSEFYNIHSLRAF